MMSILLVMGCKGGFFFRNVTCEEADLKEEMEDVAKAYLIKFPLEDVTVINQDGSYVNMRGTGVVQQKFDLSTKKASRLYFYLLRIYHFSNGCMK